MKSAVPVKTVFVLGAGASREAGGPLMSDFVKRMREFQKQGGWAANSFGEVLDARKKLAGAFAASRPDPDNIEDLFGMFEMAAVLGHLGDIEGRRVEQLPHHLRLAMLRTLELSIEFPLYDQDRSSVFDGQASLGGPYPYDAFTALVQEINETDEFGPVAVITFNYDLALDYCLAAADVKTEYGFGEATIRRDRSELLLLKPHGSLNWHSGDSGVSALPVRVLPQDVYRYRLGHHGPRKVQIDINELLHGPDLGGRQPHPAPVIIPPSWTKGSGQNLLRRVWQNGRQALSTAENILVIGYSMPPSDQFFRFFFGLSTMADNLLDRFWVFDPGEIVERYESLLGPAIRRRFSHHRMTFSEALRYLSKEFSTSDYVRQLLRRGERYGGQ